MDTSPNSRPLGWFFVVWAGFVYVWGLLAMWGLNPKTLFLLTQCQGFGLPQNPCAPQGFLALLTIDPAVTLAFTALMALYVALLWRGLAGGIPCHSLWAYFALQGVLVGVIFVVGHQQIVALSLYLALTLAAISMFRRVGAVIAVAGCCFVLFLLAGAASGTLPAQIDWRTYLLATDYPAIILFVVGYLVLYAQQIQDQAHRDTAHADLAGAHAELVRTHAQLVASAARIEELTVVAERQRLARDLHDTLAQGLAGVIMQLQVANTRLSSGRSEQAHEVVKEAMACARTTLADARSAIDDLRSVLPPDQDLPAAVRGHIERFTSATGIACTCEMAAFSILPVPLWTHALTVITEGLTNVARHAQASHVWVHAYFGETTLTIELRDNGIGFDPTSAGSVAGHYGLLGLCERARLAGGCLDIHSAPQMGTTLRFRVPRGEQGDGKPDSARRSVL